jgi:hypothetical protein
MPGGIKVAHPVMDVELHFQIRPEHGKYYPMMIAIARDGAWVESCLHTRGLKTKALAQEVINNAAKLLSHTAEGSDADSDQYDRRNESWQNPR